MRLTPQSIIRSFRSSGKKHLLLTGSRGSGKSTLAKALAGLLGGTGDDFLLPGFTTFVLPKEKVILRENTTGRQAVIGRYQEPEDGDDSAGGCMKPVMAGLETLGQEILSGCLEGKGAASLSMPGGEEALGGPPAERELWDSWVMLDELGYLESGCEVFCRAVEALFKKKRVLAVVRKLPTAFLDRLRSRKDVYLYDLDDPAPPVGCVIMASGLGRRFGGNKLLAQWEGKSLIARVLEQTSGMFACRVVVTRYPEIASLCRKQGIVCVRHDLPGRNDTVRLGMEALDGRNDALERGVEALDGRNLSGYVFCPADQPLLTRETLETLLLEFGQNGSSSGIFRLSWKGKPGAPVLFGVDYREELLALPPGKGGSWLLQKYPERVRTVEASREEELWDVDTPEDLERLLRTTL